MQRASSLDSSSSSRTLAARTPSPHHCSLSRTAAPQEHCIVVLVAAYCSPLEKTFRCAVERMERTTRSVFIVSLVTVVPHVSGGMKFPVASVDKKWREEAVQHQFKALYFCVQNVKHLFQKRQVELEILVKPGETNEIIANQVAQKYRPRWIVVDSSLLNGWQGMQFKQTLVQNPDLRKVSNLAFIPGGSEDPSFELCGAFFAANNPVVTTVEVTASNETTVEEHTEEWNSVGCGLFTCFRASRVINKRSVSRDEERASFQMRTRNGKMKVI